MTMPETRTYSIVIAHDKAESLAEESAQSIAIHIDSDDYLKQPYIVLRTSPFELDISHYSRWESSPYKIVRREFVRALSSTGRFNAVKSTSSTPKDFYLLAIELRQFELLKKEGKSFSTLEMDVVLRSPKGAELFNKRISKERALVENDSRALAEGLSDLLSEVLEESIHSITDNL
jgi:ABC-type uncharacterized transport system auxiliary subunit